MFCENCNLKVSGTIRICPKCGHKSFSQTLSESNNKSRKSRISVINTRRGSPGIYQVHPWPRFWARTIDTILFTIFLSFSLYFFFPQYTIVEANLINFLCILLYNELHNKHLMIYKHNPFLFLSR